MNSILMKGTIFNLFCQTPESYKGYPSLVCQKRLEGKMCALKMIVTLKFSVLNVTKYGNAIRILYV